MPFIGPFYPGTTLPSFALIPDSAAYNAQGGTETLSTKLQGGLGRYRREQLGASDTITVQYTCNPIRYQYARSFYREATQMGSEPFQAQLLLDAPTLSDYKCYVVAESGFRLPNQVGLTYTVTLTLEVVPLVAVDPAFDDAVILMYNVYGESGGNVLADFNNLVNNVFPTV
jgi:hypothetical protein